MKQIPMPAVVAAVVVIVLLAVFIGFKSLSHPSSDNSATATGKSVEGDQKAQYEAMHNGSNMPPGSQSGGMQGYPGSGRGAGSGGR